MWFMSLYLHCEGCNVRRAHAQPWREEWKLTGEKCNTHALCKKSCDGFPAFLLAHREDAGKIEEINGRRFYQGRCCDFLPLWEIEDCFLHVVKCIAFSSYSCILGPFNKCSWLMHFTVSGVQEWSIATKSDAKKVGEFHVFAYGMFRAARYTKGL